MAPTADVSCRVAWADDAEAVARVQLAALRADSPELLPSELRSPGEHDAEALAELTGIWRGSLSRPTEARQRVLVALERSAVRGFALTSPAGDPDADPGDGELVDLVVDPAHRRDGHGSRLLQAAVDTLKADRFERATTWVVSEDDARRAFLTSAGWEADGAHRTLGEGSEGASARQVRLHVGIADG
ncbi:GNAT family N-acetyltransferase [Nocardioidaceae bacterium]|nr:GNAT family N-acetyltransferase [Nocardioidaceae bacterium]